MALSADSAACQRLGIAGDHYTNAECQHQCHDQIGLTFHYYLLLTLPWLNSVARARDSADYRACDALMTTGSSDDYITKPKPIRGFSVSHRLPTVTFHVQAMNRR